MYNALTDSQFMTYFALDQYIERVDRYGHTVTEAKSMSIEQPLSESSMDGNRSSQANGTDKSKGQKDSEPYMPPHSMRGGRRGGHNNGDRDTPSGGLYSSDLYDADPSRDNEEEGAYGGRVRMGDSPSLYTSSPDEARSQGRFGRESVLPSAIRDSDTGGDRELARQMQNACLEESERTGTNMFGRPVRLDSPNSRNENRQQTPLSANRSHDNERSSRYGSVETSADSMYCHPGSAQRSRDARETDDSRDRPPQSHPSRRDNFSQWSPIDRRADNDRHNRDNMGDGQSFRPLRRDTRDNVCNTNSDYKTRGSRADQ